MTDCSPSHSLLSEQGLPQSRPPILTEADVLITSVLVDRPVRQPDLSVENHAFATLAHQLTDEPQSRLKTLVQIARNLFYPADTVGVSLLETLADGSSVFRWVAIAGALESWEQTTTPSNFSPCGTTTRCGCPQLYARPERYFTYLHQPQFSILEGLLIPICVNDQTLGILWLFSHTEQRQFDREDLRLATSLTGFAAAALQSMHLRQMAGLRVQAEQSLQESEAFNHSVFESSADCIKVLDLDGYVLSMNGPGRCLMEVEDCTPLFGTAWIQFWQDTDQANAAQAIKTAQAGGTGEFSGYCPTFKGTPKWWDVVVTPVLDGLGKPKQLLVVSRDISDRKRVEATQQFLLESSALLAASLDYEVALKNVAHLAVPTLADWCVIDIFMDDQSVQHLAIASAYPIKTKIMEEIQRRYPRSADRRRSIFFRLKEGKSVFHPEFPDSLIAGFAEDEEHHQLLSSLEIRSLMLMPLYSRGQLFGSICFTTADSGRYYGEADLAFAEDIARRAATAIDNARLYQETQQAKQAAERAVNRMMRLQRITSAFSEALTPQEVADVVVNQGISALGATSGSVVLLTEGATTLKIVQAIGYPQPVIDTWASFPLNAPVPLAETVRTGKSIFLPNPAALMTEYPHLESALRITEHQAIASIPLIVEGKTIGALGLSFTIPQEFSQEDRGFMLTLGQQCGQAIARAQLYEAEKIARAEAETANRLKDEFLAVLSHEIRTPLNPILGWARLLRTGKHDEATTLRALETIERNAKIQTQLIEDLLDVSRILQGKLSLNIYAVDLSAVIAAGLETVRLAADAKSIQLQMDLTSNRSQVMGDSNRLQQVIWNLLSNAVKFTPTGGRVEVSLSQIEHDAQIQVIDTGRGISPEFLPHVFEYFRQADGKTTRTFGGLGLGLAIVRNLVELHGGTIRAESAGEGQGATFTVRLPLLKIADSPELTIEPAHSALAIEKTLLAGVCILFVDDQADVRELFGVALSQYGAMIQTVASASEALQALAQSKPDILVSDIGMPVMDGYMLLREVRKLPIAAGGTIPAIALTAYAGEIDQQQALAAGFQRHLTKPIEPEVLVSAIAQMTAQ